MSTKAKAIKTLYRAKRISLKSIKQAVMKKLMTDSEYVEITGKQYIE